MKYELHGEVDEPVFPSSSGTIQLNPKFLFGSVDKTLARYLLKFNCVHFLN